MNRKLLMRTVPLAVALLAAIGWGFSPLAIAPGGVAAETTVGAPWISMEIPANPMDATTRGAVMLVHVYHHEHPAGYGVSGAAEGIVDGKRRSVDLVLEETSRPNVYALKQQWPDQGDWLLKIGIEQRALATLLVELGPDGGVVPGKFFEQPIDMLALRSVSIVAGTVAQDQIEETLRRLSSRSTE